MPGSPSDGNAAVGRFEAVFEHAFDAIVVADDDGRYVDANPSACELFGLDREELLGRRIEEFAPADYDFEGEWGAFQEGSAPVGQFPLERPDGQVRLVEYAATPNIQAGEHLSILRDVTDRVANEEALQRQLERLDEFASMVSHDLRNPLTVAFGQLERFHETGEEEHYEAAVGALRSMERITSELLTLARRGDARGERTPIELGALAREVWAEIDSRDAALEVVEDTTVEAVRGQLHLLLANLFRNAVGHGGFDVTVRVGALAEGFYVEDTGGGIPPESREEVLESGFSTGYGGSGVGLTIVQQIASAHDWSIGVGESEEGGARFEFRRA